MAVSIDITCPLEYDVVKFRRNAVLHVHGNLLPSTRRHEFCPNVLNYMEVKITEDHKF